MPKTDDGTPLAPVPRVTLTREEAAAAMGVSLDSFERYVQPSIRLIRLSGRLVLVPVSELQRWASAAAEATLR
jgi:excisionase family DNA binding protein